MHQRVWRFVGYFELNAGWIFLPLLAFSLASASAQTATNVLPPLAPAYPEMPPTFLEQQKSIVEQHVLITSVIASSLSAFVVGLLMQIFRTKQQTGPSPETVARRALEKLRTQPEDGRLLSEVSQILRHYFVAALNFPAGELTTAELQSALAQSKQINPGLAEAISRFLREGDERKFSKTNVSAPLNAVDHALEILDQAEIQRQAACATQK